MRDDLSARTILNLIRSQPELLPAAPNGGSNRATDLRRSEGHICLRCGEQADWPFVVHTPTGDRWLDLCGDCLDWFRDFLRAVS